MMSEPEKTLARKVKQDVCLTLFDLPPDWRSLWWGMPEFNMGDARPQYKITMNFMTLEDVVEFGRRLGINCTAKTDSAWFPEQKLDAPKSWEYVND